MMKKLLITLFTALMASASFGQITTTIGPHTPGDTVASTGMHVVGYFTNTGSTTIPAGDTVFYWLTLDGGALTFGGTSGSVNFNVLDYDLAPGQRFERSAALTFTAGVSMTTIQEVCVNSCVGQANLSSPSSACYYIRRSFTSTPEVTLEKATKVYVANNFLNLSSTVKENLTYTVVSITGQVVSQGTFTSNKQVDLNGISKGIYAVIVTNGTEKVTKKVAVQ